MRYYKKTEGSYIQAIGTGAGGDEITREEYENILSVILSCPSPEAGYAYRLKTDLTLELVELPPESKDPELSDSAALAIILGGGV